MIYLHITEINQSIHPELKVSVTTIERKRVKATYVNYGGVRTKVEYLKSDRDIEILMIDDEIDYEVEDGKAVRVILLQMFDEDKAASRLYKSDETEEFRNYEI